MSKLQFDGRRLDDICDYFTYVLVPACFFIEAGLLPHPIWAVLPVLASAYGFSQDHAKTPDGFFLGFPSYWNVLAMYVYVLDMQPTSALWLVLGCSIAVFVPLRYIYPSRTRPLRTLTLAVLGLWVLGFSWLSVRPNPEPTWLWLSLVGPAYYLGVSLAMNVWKPR